ncbi:hypothetical protein L208DRAFT_1336363 [Tricholoma matsutake]|nr:hypothetical protein L208DRAFT_1336363 [Tricholoma matsutake 945]
MGFEAEKNATEHKFSDAERPVLDPRFDQPTPSPYKRAALVIFTILLFWIALSLRASLLAHKRSSKVIYASRYSKEHKFRPAASPIITHTLKDGRLRIHGAGPAATAAATPIAKKTKEKRRSKRGAKRTKSASKKK